MFGSVLYICLCFMALRPYIANAMTEEQKAKIHEHFTQVGIECIEDFPISEDDIKSFRSKNMGTGENAPCFLSCMLKKIGIMDDKGMLNKENVLEKAKQVFQDPEEIQMLEAYLHSCASVNTASVGDGEKGCERATLAFKCMKDNAAQFGFDL